MTRPVQMKTPESTANGYARYFARETNPITKVIANRTTIEVSIRWADSRELCGAEVIVSRDGNSSVVTYPLSARSLNAYNVDDDSAPRDFFPPLATHFFCARVFLIAGFNVREF